MLEVELQVVNNKDKFISQNCYLFVPVVVERGCT